MDVMIVKGERRSEESERRVIACVNACEGFSTESLELPEFFSATLRGYRLMVEEGEARIAELEAQIDKLKRRLEVDERHGYDGIAARDMTIKELESKCDSIQKKADADGFDYADNLYSITAQRDELLSVLHRLACLGNGDRYGNSDGNIIAQEAIAKIEASVGATAEKAK